MPPDVAAERSAAHSSTRAFALVRLNDRPPKPRHVGITEIRGPYYTPMGPRYLEDVLETMGWYVDALKFAGGSFSLMPNACAPASGVRRTSGEESKPSKSEHDSRLSTYDHGERAEAADQSRETTEEHDNKKQTTTATECRAGN